LVVIKSFNCKGHSFCPVLVFFKRRQCLKRDGVSALGLIRLTVHFHLRLQNSECPSVQGSATFELKSSEWNDSFGLSLVVSYLGLKEAFKGICQLSY